MSEVFWYRGQQYPGYLKNGNAQQYIAPVALQFCKGRGLDIGCGKWPLPGAVPIEKANGDDANGLPEGEFDYVFSSHCLEHLDDPVSTLEHWRSRLRPGGVLFLYLPHAEMIYWRPQHCRKHRHLFWPKDVAMMLRDLGFINVLHSERDLVWSFACVGFKGEK
jgi:2-polyprenyl-3-methyl-5-hydroxy-6-metoxy-1,4-benzoquinol methylase